jgi:hypothetical protein
MLVREVPPRSAILKGALPAANGTGTVVTCALCFDAVINSTRPIAPEISPATKQELAEIEGTSLIFQLAHEA